MNNDSLIFIDLDTHKSFIQVALLRENRGVKPEQLGRIKPNSGNIVRCPH